MRTTKYKKKSEIKRSTFNLETGAACPFITSSTVCSTNFPPAPFSSLSLLSSSVSSSAPSCSLPWFPSPSPLPLSSSSSTTTSSSSAEDDCSHSTSIASRTDVEGLALLRTLSALPASFSTSPNSRFHSSHSSCACSSTSCAYAASSSSGYNVI